MEIKSINGLKSLGNKTPVPDIPSKDILEVFENPNKDRPYVIEHSSDEFVSLCPVTGAPDFATYSIRYIANKSCVETKSLKLYMQSWRNTPTFMEAAVNDVLNALVATLFPRAMTIDFYFNPRGGVRSGIRVLHMDNNVSFDDSEYYMMLINAFVS
jgi:7-cyano-7-deazaguanine reductase